MATSGPRRTPFEIARDRALVARLYLEGKTQAEIGERLGFTQQQISYDLKEIHEEWRNSTNLDLEQEKGKQLAKLDMLEIELWEAWLASKGEQKSEGSRLVQFPARSEAVVVPDGKGGHNSKIVSVPGGQKSESYLKKYVRHGNPEYLQTYLQCVTERNKILGLYKTDKKGTITLDLVLAALPEEFREEVRRQLQEDIPPETHSSVSA